MEEYEEGYFYKEAIGQLISETEDLDLLDLVYKILAEGKKVNIL